MLDDWVTIWQSELAGMVLDRELQEAQLRLIDAWAAQARAILALAAAGPADAPGRPAGSAAAAWAAPTSAAPDERDAVIARLAARIAELERQLGQPGPP